MHLEALRAPIVVSTRTAALFGVFACVVIWPAMFVLGSLRPSYSQVTNYISELGAIGAPHAAAWNIVGFIIPGVLLAFAGKAVGNSPRPKSLASRTAGWLLLLFGISVAGQGLFPAVMKDAQLVVTSWHTTTHLLMSLLSGIAWIVALLLLIVPMRRDPRWRGWYVLNVAAVLLVLIGSASLRGAVPDGLSQRIVDALVFGWFIATSLKLLQLDRANPVK
jgi:hypothetical membrane protein